MKAIAKKEIVKALRSLNTTIIFKTAKKAGIDVNDRSEVMSFIQKYSPSKKVSKRACSIAYSSNDNMRPFDFGNVFLPIQRVIAFA